MKHIIILGLERSGTTWLLYHFHHRRDICVRNEFKVIPAMYEAYKYLNSYKRQEVNTDLLIVLMRRWLLKLYGKQEHHNILIDKHTLNLEQNIDFIIFLQRLFPTAQYVFIKRDPKNIVKSMMDKRRGTSKKDEDSLIAYSLAESIEIVNKVNRSVRRWVKENAEVVEYEKILKGETTIDDLKEIMGIEGEVNDFKIKYPSTYKDRFNKKTQKKLEDLMLEF